MDLKQRGSDVSESSKHAFPQCRNVDIQDRLKVAFSHHCKSCVGKENITSIFGSEERDIQKQPLSTPAPLESISSIEPSSLLPSYRLRVEIVKNVELLAHTRDLEQQLELL